MKIEIQVPDYSPEEGLRFEWEETFTIEAQIKNNSVIVRADRGGLISLARHLMTLAYAPVSSGYHFHLDESNALADGSCELIFEKG